jgi:hypothetical protein
VRGKQALCLGLPVGGAGNNDTCRVRVSLKNPEGLNKHGGTAQFTKLLRLATKSSSTARRS